ncbi:TetR/AcrR family transcriptional regulator [Haliea sp. E17]|uniref:TetR/AcrR family transcriptional regulator n=1 Tax=Haliea sp. E17 TaxID=3401576 RepID=UPI003AAA9854
MSSKAVSPQKISARDKLIDAAGQLMLECGYAAVTSRRVAAQAGLKPQLVHYYFRSMDDLYLALYHRFVEGLVERQEAVLQSSTPLRALWEMMRDSRGVLLTEFQALANHKQGIRQEIASFSRHFREEQVRIIEELYSTRDMSGFTLSPAMLSLTLNALSRSLATETQFDITAAHEEALGLVERLITGVDEAPLV